VDSPKKFTWDPAFDQELGSLLERLGDEKE